VVITSRLAQIGHLRLQGAPVSVGGEMAYADVVADRPVKAMQEEPAAAALAGEAEPAAVSTPWVRWSSMWP